MSASIPALDARVRPGERRKNPRFDLHLPVFLRALGDPWSTTETADVSGAGAFFVTDRPFLLNTPVEYVLTFPPERTKAAHPLRVRFFGSVLRCENVPDGNGLYGVAVRNTTHRYLTPTESANFDTLEPKPVPSDNLSAGASERTTGT
ncbi:MAG TPA: PilZ domain-containing protein [Candidatus Angelobacter sp.]|nr:PilZ domain-containing protein [Candidatus Angelobacter sp.]